jgi:hypothetical protein
VERLEQVRLAGTVRTDDEDQSRFEFEIEARVGANVAERNLVDDQISPAKASLATPTIEGVRALPGRPFAFEKPLAARLGPRASLTPAT